MNRQNTTQSPELLQITQPVILFNLRRTYQPGMTPDELYEATRGNWNVSARIARRAAFAYGTYQGQVMQVYRIHDWSESDETWGRKKKHPRHRFTGSVAEDYRHHIGRDISHYVSNPRSCFNYLNCH